MKKRLKKIIQMITLFIIGTGGKTSASKQSVIYGPPQDILNKKINKNVKIIIGSIIVLLIVLIIVLKICLF